MRAPRLADCVAVRLNAAQGNVRTPQPQLDQVISYIRAKWPFYDRRGECCVGEGVRAHAVCKTVVCLRVYSCTARGALRPAHGSHPGGPAFWANVCSYPAAAVPPTLPPYTAVA